MTELQTTVQLWGPRPDYENLRANNILINESLSIASYIKMNGKLATNQ